MFKLPPNISDFTDFLLNVVGIPPAQMPTGILTDSSGAPILDSNGNPVQGGPNWVWFALRVACATVNEYLLVSCEMYLLAVYNLGADRLMNYAQDQRGQTYFKDIRRNLKLGAFTPGVVTSASDQGTSTALLDIEAAKTFTIADLQTLKTPWGRTYMGIAQDVGTLWGLS